MSGIALDLSFIHAASAIASVTSTLLIGGGALVLLGALPSAPAAGPSLARRAA